jgi:predicted metal-binding membrane protein
MAAFGAFTVRESTQRASSERLSHYVFLGVSASVSAVSAVGTVLWSTSMSAMGTMSMPGGWSMSMTWMRMPRQSWFAAGVAFIGMWIVMMMAMMLPSLLPSLWRYRNALVNEGRGSVGTLTTLTAVGYFLVWTVFGLVAYPIGAAFAAVEMRQSAVANAVPLAVGVTVLIAGALQFTGWKARQLLCCRASPGSGRALPAKPGTAWQYGVRLGLRCSSCCGALMVVLLIVGVMDLRAMALVTAATTLERVAPAGERVARATGAFVVGTGMLLIARAVVMHPVPWPA